MKKPKKSRKCLTLRQASLMKYIVGFGLSENDILLDFFSGSATMCEAILRANSEDAGHRKYIAVQLDENLDKNLDKADSNEKLIIQNAISVLNAIGKPHYITELAKERIRRAGEKIKDGHNRVDIYVSAIDDIIKNESIKSDIKSYVREVENKWFENENDPDIKEETEGKMKEKSKCGQEQSKKKSFRISYARACLRLRGSCSISTMKLRFFGTNSYLL